MFFEFSVLYYQWLINQRSPTDYDANLCFFSLFHKFFVNLRPKFTNMTTRDALLVINPVSGTRSKKGIDREVAERLASADINVTTAFTEGPGHGAELASRAAEQGVDLVIAAGGDGTVNEVASAISHTSTSLAIVPLGSGNGLARTLGIPQDTAEALDIIAADHRIVCDRGLINGTPFYCTCGMGFDALVSEKFASEKHRGPITYIRCVLREFLRYKSQPYAIYIDGRVITERAFLIAVCNASQYGNNAYIAPQAKLSDGFLDLIVVHDGSPFSTVKMGVDLMSGYLDRNTRIDSFRVSTATITRLEKGPVHIDGEPLAMGTRMEVKCDPASLSVVAPEKVEDFRPIVSPFRAMISDFRAEFRSMLFSR